MRLVVLEGEGGAALGGEGELREPRLAALEAVVEVDEEGQLGPLAAGALEVAVAVLPEALAGLVAVDADAFVAPGRRPASTSREVRGEAREEERRPARVVEDDAVVAAHAVVVRDAVPADQRPFAEAERLRAFDPLGALFGGQRVVDREDERGALEHLHHRHRMCLERRITSLVLAIRLAVYWGRAVALIVVTRARARSGCGAGGARLSRSNLAGCAFMTPGAAR